MAAVNRNTKRQKISHKPNATKQQDRLSYLPEPILVNILSLLPIDTAIAATLLSRQWLNLWTHVNAINIDITSSKGPFKNWTSFHKYVLPKLTSPFINKITFDLKCYDLSKYKLSVIDSWFRKIAGCWNIDEIQATLDGLDEGKDYFPEIFKVKSLVKLEIRCGFAWKLVKHEFDKEINLPNLKKLTMQIHLAQYKFLNHLLKSCTSLEDLSLIFEDKFEKKHYKEHYFYVPLVLDLSSPSLKKLMLMFPRGELQYLTEEIKINAPKLEFFGLDFVRDFETFHFVSELSRLMEVDLSGTSIRGGFRPNLLKAITNARSLSLGCPDQISTDHIDDDDNVKFTNLTRLMCMVPSSEEGFKKLLALLEKCPVLEFLTLKFTTSILRKKKMSCLMLLAFCSTPILTLKHVKMLEINFMSTKLLDTHASNLIKVLVNSVHVTLERLIFKVGDDNLPETEDRNEMEAHKEFFEWVKWYTNSRCEVRYLGKKIQND